MAIIYNPTSIPLRIPFAHYKGYNYIKPIRIVGVNTKLIDYQVKIELDSTNFPFEKCRADGYDVRFLDADGQPLDYWLESWSKSSKSATLWSKIPEIPSRTDKLIWLIYGNPSASSASNGGSTFIDFDAQETDPPNWTEDTTVGYEGNMACVRDAIHAEGTYSTKFTCTSASKGAWNFDISDISSDNNRALEFWYNAKYTQGHIRLQSQQLVSSANTLIYMITDGTDLKHYTGGGWVKICNLNFETWVKIVLYNVDFTNNQFDIKAYDTAGNLLGTLTDTGFYSAQASATYLLIIDSSTSTEALTYIDCLFQRKYNSSEPQIKVL